MVPSSAPVHVGLRPGDELDRYTVIRLLGAGGMAEVWEVRHRVLGSRLALKVLRAGDSGQLTRLIAEGRAQAALEHENLLPVRDTVAVGEALGLVLPLVEGPALDVLSRAYRPTEDEALALFRAVVRGVSVVHAQGWVHRDLKPANVLLDLRAGSVVPRVADFGLVLSGGAELSKGFFGTLAYAAPEQLRDAASVDARADLWSLGVLLVELLTGARPFASDTPADLEAAHRAGPSLHGLRGPLVFIVRGLLTTDPASRLGSCEALLSLLDELPRPAVDPLREPGPLYHAVCERRRPAVDAATPATFELGSEPSAELPQRPRENLPPRRDQFLGRVDELARLEAVVRRGAALVTLQGVGGAGKTRLAVEFASQTLNLWPGGVWFCELTEARDQEGVIAAVARSLDVALQHGDAVAQLGHVMATRGRALYLFDNAEQVSGVLARLVEGWLERVGAAVFLVTSREVLRLERETVLEVGALELPSRRAESPLEVASASAGALLIARAQEAVSGWTLRPGEVTAAAELLALLDGLPLAIELAAARLRVMSLPALRERIRDRFKVLASPGRGTERQSTMRAVLDWSWNLLSEPERLALAQLGVFEGGFSLDAAEAVVELPADAPWVIDVLQLLMERSLVRLTSAADQDPRFNMYVSVREYAAEKLLGAERIGAEARHGAHYAQLGEQGAVDALVGPGGRAQADLLLRERDNLQAACQRALTRRDAAVALGSLRASSELLPLVGGARVGEERLVLEVLALTRELPPGPDRDALVAEAHHRASRTLQWLARPADALQLAEAGLEIGVGGRLQARLVCLRGELLLELSRRREAQEVLEAGVRLAERVGDLSLQSRALRQLAELTLNASGRDAARPYAEGALRIARAAGDRVGEAQSLLIVCGLMVRDGPSEEQLQQQQAALMLAREIGHRDLETRALLHLAIHHKELGRHAEALRLGQQVLALARDQGNRWHEALVLMDIADMYACQQKHLAAIDTNLTALSLVQQQGRTRALPILYCNLSFSYLELGRLDEAEAAITEGIRVGHETSMSWMVGIIEQAHGRLLGQRGRLGEAREAFDRSAALLEADGHRPELACTWLERAVVEQQHGEREAALLAFRRGEAMAESLLTVEGSLVGDALAKARRVMAGAEGVPA